MSPVCHDQPIVKETVARRINSEAAHLPEGMLPSEVMERFFRNFPKENGLHFLNHERSQIYSLKEIEEVEKTVSDKLLHVYTKFTQPPSPRDVMTDVFAELDQLGIHVSMSLKSR
jgi:hypothetical protein